MAKKLAHPLKQKKELLVLVLIMVVFITTFCFVLYPKNHENTTKQSGVVDTVIVNQTNGDPVFNITIPKLSIDAPIIIGVDPIDKKKYDESLTKGVALMQGSSLPGLSGNIFIYGHSSSDIQSPYEKIFATLNDLVIGDQIKVHYKGQNFTYAVSKQKIIDKDDLSVLQSTTEETLTLMTCWPVGTSKQRLVVISLRKNE